MEIQKEEPPLDRDLILSRIDHSAQNPDIGFIETLYRTCTAVLVHLWKYGNRPTPGSRENILRKDVADLSRWDENFLPGNLDATIEQSHHLRINVIENLVGIGKILVSFSAPAETPVDTKEKTRLRITPHQELRTQLEKAKIILSTEEHSDSCPSSDDETSDDSCSESERDQNRYGRLHCYIKCMVNLIPLIDKYGSYLQNKRETSSKPKGAFSNLSQSAQPYAMRILDRFADAPLFLIERLAEANWERSIRLRELQDDDNAGKGNDISTISKPHPLFLGRSLGSVYAGTASSHISFTSSSQEESQDRPRVPPLPEKGELFRCNYCQRNIRLRSQTQWTVHVFGDLQSYLCTHDRCKDALRTFPSRGLWAEHEFDEHFTVTKWRCSTCNYIAPTKSRWVEHMSVTHSINLSGHHLTAEISRAEEKVLDPQFKDYKCPLCLQTGWKATNTYVTHMGRHLEDISLASLPRNEGLLSDDISGIDSASNNPTDRHNKTSLSKPIQDKVVFDGLDSIEREELLSLADKLLTETSPEEIQKIKAKLSALSLEQKEFLTRKEVDPITCFFQSQALPLVYRWREPSASVIMDWEIAREFLDTVFHTRVHLPLDNVSALAKGYHNKIQAEHKNFQAAQPLRDETPLPSPMLSSLHTANDEHNRNAGSLWVCPECHRGFGRKAVFVRHMKIQHYPSVTYVCQAGCIKRHFDLLDHLKEHLLSTHGIRTSRPNVQKSAIDRTCPGRCAHCGRNTPDWEQFYECLANHCMATKSSEGFPSALRRHLIQDMGLKNIDEHKNKQAQVSPDIEKTPNVMNKREFLFKQSEPYDRSSVRYENGESARLVDADNLAEAGVREPMAAAIDAEKKDAHLL